MSDFQRYAIYFTPEPGSLAEAGATWLGWDIDAGKPATQPQIAGLEQITRAPRKYGFHATLKPPFRLRGYLADLEEAVTDIAGRHQPFLLDGLRIAELGRFVALVPVGDTTRLNALARDCVVHADGFRMPADDAELERRRAAGLTAKEDENLIRWGYPYVMDAFRFHLTLSGRLDPSVVPNVADAAALHLPPVGVPLSVAQITLVGEREDGLFQTIRRYPLGGEIDGR